MGTGSPILGYESRRSTWEDLRGVRVTRFRRPDPAPSILSLSVVIAILGVFALITFAAGLDWLIEPGLSLRGDVGSSLGAGLPGMIFCWCTVGALVWLILQFAKNIASLKRGGTQVITIAMVEGVMHIEDAALDVSPVVVNPREVTSIEVQRLSDAAFVLQICRPPATPVIFRFVEHDFRAAMTVRNELRSELGLADQGIPQ